MSKALEIFYLKEHKNLVKIYTKKAGSVEDAEDIVQEAFVSALTYFDKFDPTKSKIGTWFYTILSRTFWHYRADGNRVETIKEKLTFELEALGDESSLCHPDFDMFELAELLELSIASQSTQSQRTILCAHFVHQLTYREIESAYQVPYKTVVDTIYRFRKAFKHKHPTLCEEFNES